MRKNLPVYAIIVVALALTACHYAVPITVNPTRHVDVRLLGTWTLVSPMRRERMKIRPFDDSNYVVT